MYVFRLSIKFNDGACINLFSSKSSTFEAIDARYCSPRLSIMDNVIHFSFTGNNLDVQCHVTVFVMCSPLLCIHRFVSIIRPWKLIFLFDPG